MADKKTQKQNNGDEFDAWLSKPTVKQPKSREEVKKKQAENISKAMRRQATEKANLTKTTRLTPYERRFCQRYVETNNGGQSVIDAGYNVSNLNTASVYASELLNKRKIQQEILRLQRPNENKAIATAQEVMERFTAIARGEEKDQFGLEISASDRLKALVELAKRTIDIENRGQGKADNVVQIKLDWSRDQQ